MISMASKLGSFEDNIIEWLFHILTTSKSILTKAIEALQMENVVYNSTYSRTVCMLDLKLKILNLEE